MIELGIVVLAIGILWLYKRWLHWESYKHHKPTVELIADPNRQRAHDAIADQRPEWRDTVKH